MRLNGNVSRDVSWVTLRSVCFGSFCLAGMSLWEVIVGMTGAVGALRVWRARGHCGAVRCLLVKRKKVKHHFRHVRTMSHPGCDHTSYVCTYLYTLLVMHFKGSSHGSESSVELR